MPTQRSFSTGWSMMPRMGTPSARRAIKVPKRGFPVMKLLVPSIGSRTQRKRVGKEEIEEEGGV